MDQMMKQTDGSRPSSRPTGNGNAGSGVNRLGCPWRTEAIAPGGVIPQSRIEAHQQVCERIARVCGEIIEQVERGQTDAALDINLDFINTLRKSLEMIRHEARMSNRPYR